MTDSTRKVKDSAIEVADLLSKALEIAKNEGSVGWVTAWLDVRDELEGYGYTVELKEQIEGLEAEKADLLAVYPKGFPLDLSVVEQLQVEEFFHHLRDPAHRPAAGDRLEALLQRCRGFKVEQLEQVLQWLDSYGLGELPFGPTDELREQLARERERSVLLERCCAAQDREALELKKELEVLQDPRLDFVRQNLDRLPLEALQWIVEQESES